MSLAELRARLIEIESRQAEIVEEHRDADLPDDIDTEWTALETEVESVRSKIAKVEARMERFKELSEKKDTVREDAERKAADEAEHRGAPAVHTHTEIRSYGDLQKESHGPEDLIRRSTDEAKRSLERAALPSLPGADQAHARSEITDLLERDTENGDLARHMLATGTKEYERAYGKFMKSGNTNGFTLADHAVVEEARALAIATDASGNFAVPYQLDPTLVHLGAGYISPIRQLAKVVQLVGREYQTFTISPVSVYRAAEGATAIDSSPTLARQKVTAEKVHGFVPFSMEVDEDWTSMRNEVFTLLSEAKDREEATAFATGTGVSPQPEGLITGATQIVDTAAAADLTVADLIKLTEALPVEFEGNAVFLGNKSVFNIIRQISTQGGADIWVPNLREANAEQLLGTRIYRTTGLANAGVAGNKFLVYGDIRQAFTIVDRIGMSVELVPHLFDSSATGNRSLPTGQRAFYAHWRNSSKVTNPNAVRVLRSKSA